MIWFQIYIISPSWLLTTRASYSLLPLPYLFVWKAEKKKVSFWCPTKMCIYNINIKICSNTWMNHHQKSNSTGYPLLLWHVVYLYGFVYYMKYLVVKTYLSIYLYILDICTPLPCLPTKQNQLILYHIYQPKVINPEICFSTHFTFTNLISLFLIVCPFPQTKVIISSHWIYRRIPCSTN